ncbi:hypothetical protein CDD81_3076 [Ophiocordyceps australis]|uniref:holo-[acyl-carrier-protein] synthase n=1 Tax=Ophiocordyceps australis TaxID=1399860 RepID=A0A2C5Y927_9HYPO|nr:hypothetical protein CDD81_3076 [Ophiocordyceps australis]
MSTFETVKWVLDTRSLWPEAKETKQLVHEASRAMALLTAGERANVLRYYFVRDAKMALGSALLKRLAIARLARVSWRESARWRRESRSGKPIFCKAKSGAAADDDDGDDDDVDDDDGGNKFVLDLADAAAPHDQGASPTWRGCSEDEPLVFNVSHQAGVVVVVAIAHAPPGTALGLDIVCPLERRARDVGILTNPDHDVSALGQGSEQRPGHKDGWPTFIAIHDSVLSPLETARLRQLSAATHGPNRRLAYFYALWCLREAFVKMTGEALLAPWLHLLEMRHFAPPDEADAPELEVWFQGTRATDVQMKLEELLHDYMVSVAVRWGQTAEPDLYARIEQPWTHLDMEAVLAEAQAAAE